MVNALPPTAATRPLVVMLPGLDGTGKLFRRFTETLSGTLDTHLIGYPRDVPLGYDALVARVAAALPTDRPFVLLAESFGGPIAIRVAAAQPAGLRGVILCTTFAKNPYPRLAWAHPLAFLVPIKSLPRWLRSLLMWGSPRPRRAPAQADRAIAGVSRAVLTRRIGELLRVDATAALGAITAPVLILYAHRDRVVPPGAMRWLAAHRPEARIVGIDGPHLLLQARPEACAAAVLDFVRQAQRNPLEWGF